MAKQNAKLGFQSATSPLAKTVRRAVAPAGTSRAAKAEQVVPDSGDEFGAFSVAEKAFLDGLAMARDAFSPTAVEARSNSKLKSL